MKAQWQLIDIETGKPLAMIGEPFDINIEIFKTEWKKQFLGLKGGNIKVLIGTFGEGKGEKV